MALLLLGIVVADTELIFLTCFHNKKTLAILYPFLAYRLAD